MRPRHTENWLMPSFIIIITAHSQHVSPQGLPFTTHRPVLEMRKILSLILLGLLQILPFTLFADENFAMKYRSWVIEMEGQERGPFARLRWFCNDGTVFPQQLYACTDHGGGYPHGELSKKTLELRQQGYLVANVLLNRLGKSHLQHDHHPWYLRTGDVRDLVQDVGIYRKRARS